ncbi:unnamed protein product [Microthlaspi erraticum]|uniref:Retrotransposon gag domain-containing protein n=1 Tax=Microthlaspi erraticum TaxID=1685480 RepID=A0A6D2IM05_9BRAS|nr:unnamed protein product [Microthlaspi erraticum]
MGKIDDLADELHGSLASVTVTVATMAENWEQQKKTNEMTNQSISEIHSNLSRLTEMMTRIVANQSNPTTINGIRRRVNRIRQISQRILHLCVRLGRYSDDDRLDLLSITLKGPALHWFNREMSREPFRDWPQFKKRMIARFSQKMEENPGKRLFSLRQTSSIADCDRD